jgi:lipopolysaccharide transport system ATP-binding protein
MSIIVEQVSKRYWLQESAPRTFQEALGRLFHTLRHGTPFWALRDLSLRVEPGEAVGLIGENGAGKSTLLRLVCGLGRPTSGRTQVDGRVAALLELGTGFHPQLSGRENVYISGVVSGLRRGEVAQRFDDIVNFADIWPFIDQPLRTYSSGMQMRLAFSVAIHVDPSVLIVDEALSVGDAHFQQKCIERVEGFRQAGKTLLIVSHDTGMIRRFCDRAIWLHQGSKVHDGPVDEVLDGYLAWLQQGSPVLKPQMTLTI